MKYLSMTAAVLALMFSIASGGDTIRRNFSIEPGKLLEVDLETGGTISVLGWENNQVEVVAFIEGRDWQECKFEFDEKPSGLEISSSFNRSWGNRKCDVDLEVKVPKNFNLDLATTGGSINLTGIQGRLKGKTNGGSLALEDLSGDIDFRTNGGSIQCSGLTGQVEIVTNGGSITCSSSNINGRIHTNGGSITMHNVSGDFDCTTNGGRVTYDNDQSFVPGKKNEVVKIWTKGGDIDVAEALLGANVRTNGGDISIESAGEFVVAETNGGDISVDAIDGWIEAHTNGGDVTVRVVGSENGKDRAIELSSNGGEITLTLPADFSGQFDLSLAYTKKTRRDYKIISDFNLDTSESDEWDYSQGSPRKYIDGRGDVNGGKNKVRIRTVNGDIKIIKG